MEFGALAQANGEGEAVGRRRPPFSEPRTRMPFFLQVHQPLEREIGAELPESSLRRLQWQAPKAHPERCGRFGQNGFGAAARGRIDEHNQPAQHADCGEQSACGCQTVSTDHYFCLSFSGVSSTKMSQKLVGLAFVVPFL